MNDIAIYSENLGKKYHLGKKRERYRTLRSTLTNTYLSSFRKAGKLFQARNLGLADRSETIWALKDVSFEIKKGELVGIIGRNGAGKSTLLKILSRVTEPTTGYAEIRGRVGSLLEVGTGFHQELTGRENVYLNGAILGMKKTEIDKKFEEIVIFAEVEKFIDTPVKHYSSGMYLRLAFAVAAHLEPEILIVDEVLAVGDVRFQKKCLDRMENVGQQGRTVIFVSHNMPAITRLCKRVILLDDGKLLQDGHSHEVVKTYLNVGQGVSSLREWPDPKKAPGGNEVRLRSVRVRSDNGQITETIDIRKPVAIEMEYDVIKPGYILLPNYGFYNEEGVQLFTALDQDPTWQQRHRPEGRYVSTAWIPGNFLAEGSVFVAVSIVTLDPVIVEFLERDVVAFQVVDSIDGDSARGNWAGNLPGVVRPILKWETQLVPAGNERGII